MISEFENKNPRLIIPPLIQNMPRSYFTQLRYPTKDFSAAVSRNLIYPGECLVLKSND